MAAQRLKFARTRTLHLICYADLSSESFDEPFAVLLPAFEAKKFEEFELIISRLMTLGAVEFCCVGPQAEQLEDSIDYIIEDHKAYDIVTTACVDIKEGCEYFVLAAAGRPTSLVAFTCDNIDLAMTLISNAQKDCDF